MTIKEKLGVIQSKLVAPKNQKNKFGNYNYRSAEDILLAVKPLLSETKTILVISDKIENLGDRYYVVATVILYDAESDEKIKSTARARESIDKKGMDTAQITGAASSYARKYAMNGLFAIDDTKDADTDEQAKEKAKDEIKEIESSNKINILKNEIASRIKKIDPILEVSNYRAYILEKTGETYNDKTTEKTMKEIIDKLEIVLEEKKLV